MKSETLNNHETENTSITPNSLEKPARRRNVRRTDPEAIAQSERVRKAIQMRIDGYSYDEIARDLNWNSKQAAFDAVSRVLERARLDDARELKLITLQRLEKCVATVMKKAINGNLLAVDRIIRLSKREGEILGFDERGKDGLQVGFEIIVRDESERPKS